MIKRLFYLAVVILITITACAPSTPSVTGDDVIAAFKAANLEAEAPRPMTKDDYGAAPYVCEGTRFFIPSLCEDCGGRIFICDNTKDRNALVTYYDELGKSSALFFSWVFSKGSVVVQINGDLDESIARQYEQAIP